MRERVNSSRLRPLILFGLSLLKPPRSKAPNAQGLS